MCSCVYVIVLAGAGKAIVWILSKLNKPVSATVKVLAKLLRVSKGEIGVLHSLTHRHYKNPARR